MKTLVVLGEPPLPEGGAPGKVALGLLRGLMANGVDVTAVAARSPWSVAGVVPGDLPVEEVAVDEDPPWRGRVSALVRPQDLLARGPFGARVRELAAGADVVHLETVETARAVGRVRTPAAVHLHYRQRLDRDPPPAWSREGRRDLAFARAEEAALRRHRWVVATSPVVAASIRAEAPSTEVVEVAMTLDDSVYPPPAARGGGPVAGLIGTGGWGPTAAATARLRERIWPRVHAAVPDGELRLAGRGIGRLAGEGVPGVEVVGEVDSAADFLAGVSVLLYPLERGSGVKVKVLEALASGVPVVTTPSGAEGIDGGEGVVVVDDDDAFVTAAVRLLGDAGERAERGRAARDAFCRAHAPAVATLPLLDLYRRMAG